MKPEFMTELVLQAYKPYEWLLFKRLIYYSPQIGKVIVPSGFRTDLASIPKIVRSFIPQNGRHRAAAVVHDYLYRYAGIHGFSRRLVDRVFLEAMEASGVPAYRRKIMYRFVRLLGRTHWARNLKVNTE